MSPYITAFYEAKTKRSTSSLIEYHQHDKIQRMLQENTLDHCAFLIKKV